MGRQPEAPVSITARHMIWYGTRSRAIFPKTRFNMSKYSNEKIIIGAKHVIKFAVFYFIVRHYHFFIIITSLLFARMPVLLLRTVYLRFFFLRF